MSTGTKTTEITKRNGYVVEKTTITKTAKHVSETYKCPYCDMKAQCYSPREIQRHVLKKHMDEVKCLHSKHVKRYEDHIGFFDSNGYIICQFSDIEQLKVYCDVFLLNNGATIYGINKFKAGWYCIKYYDGACMLVNAVDFLNEQIAEKEQEIKAIQELKERL